MKRIDKIERKMKKLVNPNNLPQRIQKRDSKIYGLYGDEWKELNEDDFEKKIEKKFHSDMGKIQVELIGEEEEKKELDPALIRIGKYAVSEDLKELVLPIGVNWVE